MELLTETLRKKLLDNGRQQELVRGTDDEIDFFPVVKLFTPDAGCTWLLTEIDPEDPDIAFGLCDLGVGCPELGSVSLSELNDLRGKLGLPVVHFEAKQSLGDYATEANRHSRINA
jgi:hypothetical protein